MHNLAHMFIGYDLYFVLLFAFYSFVLYNFR